MAITIYFRHGTKAQLDSMSLNANEPAFITDTKELYVGDGTYNHLIGRVWVDTLANRPTAGTKGRLFYATDTLETYVDDGTQWSKVGIRHLSELDGTLDDIPDGTLYQKVSANEVDSQGRVNRINDGTNVVTAAEARAHIGNEALHRTIDDTAHDSVHLLSSQEVDNRIHSAVNGLDRQDSVLDIRSNPPTDPNEGDRYIVGSGPTGDWSGHYNDIAMYENGTWTFIVPNPGFTSYVEDENCDYQFNTSSQWIKVPTNISHNNLLGIQGGQSGERYHLTETQWEAAIREATDYQNGLMSIADHQRLPTTGQKDALIGTDGIPSATNKYVTDSDPRLTDARTPEAHAATHQHGGSDEIATTTPAAFAIPKANSQGNLNDWITVIDGGTLV